VSGAVVAQAPCSEKSTMSSHTQALENKALVQASFDRWRAGTGSPFELLVPEADWTIVGSSPLSKTYANRQAFLDEVIQPFNARMATPLVPTVRGIYADGDMVIALFDAAATTKDGLPYRNTYTWYFRMKDAKVVSAIAFFDTREFDEFWNRVSPVK
jgi:ketosteroid isomerase-like protein